MKKKHYPKRFFLLTGLLFLLLVSSTSLDAQIKVLTPVISAQPVNVEFCDTDIRTSTAFTVTASNVTTYQWYQYYYDFLTRKYIWKALTNVKGSIAGATGATLTVYKPILNGWATGDSKTLKVVLTNSFGSTTSNTVYLIVNTAPVFTTQPADQTAWIGESASFTGIASGKPAPAYQWQYEVLRSVWSNIKGETENVFTTITSRNYRVLAHNTCGTATSGSASLTAVGISSQPANVTQCGPYKSNISFTVGASGATAYQWYVWVPDIFIKGGGTWTAVKGAIAAAYTKVAPIGGFTSSNNDKFRCLVTFPLGTQYSNEVYLTINMKPSISNHPSGASKNVGESVTFSVTASSTLSKSYQWYKDGGALSGATGSSLSLSNLQPEDGGAYHCVVTNSCGSVQSNAATLEVVQLEWPQAWFNQRTNADPINSKYMFDVHAISKNVAWAAVSQEYDSLIFTTDGGATWNWTHTGVAHRYYWQSVFFTDANHGWVGGYRTIAYTTDGGTTWNEWYDAAAVYSFTDLYFVSNSLGWAVATDGRIYRTINGGVVWSEQKNTGADMKSVYFTDMNNGIATGAGGIVAYTSNGGTNWTVVATSYGAINAVYMVNATTGYAITGSQFIKTTDGGANWSLVSNRGGMNLSFLDANNGWICGYSGQIYFTNNSGVTWHTQVTETSSTLYSISMVDEDNGWAVGYDGAMQRTAFGGCKLPRVNLQDDQEFCANESYRLRADTFGSANYSYLWSNGTTSGSIWVSESNSYYVDVFNVCGDKASDTVSVLFYPLPEVDAGSDTAVCFGDTIQLSASGGVLYDWGGSPGYQSDRYIPNPLVYPPAGVWGYNVNVTDTNGCSSVGSMILTVNQIPVASMSATSFVCEKAAAFVLYNGNATGKADFWWDWDGGVAVASKGGYDVTWESPGERTISLAVVENECFSDTGMHKITVNPIPASGFSLQARGCDSMAVDIVYSGIDSLGADYTWNFNGGRVVSGEREGPYQVSWTTGGTKTVSLTVTQSECVSEMTSNDVLISYPYEGQEFCLISVDLETGRNLLIWEGPQDAGIQSYNLYREGDKSGQYDLIKSAEADRLTVFVDMTSEPEQQQHLYKIAVMDTCGNESELSTYHKTMFLQYVSSVGGVNLNWRKYEIEGNPVNFDSYLIYRGSDSTQLKLVKTISGSLENWTDTDPEVLTKRFYYRIAGVSGDTCRPAGTIGKKAGAGPYSQSLSNLEDNKIKTGTNVQDLISQKYQLGVYPNPFRDATSVNYSLDASSDVRIEIYNILGSRVLDLANEFQYPGTYKYDINSGQLGTDAVYYLRFTVDDKTVVKKLLPVK